MQKPTKGCDQRRERSQDDDVKLHRRHSQGSRQEVPAMRYEGESVSVWDENRIRVALQSREDVGAEIVHWTDEVLRSHKDVGEEEAKEYCADPGAHEASRKD